MRTVFQDHNLNRLHQGTARCVIAELPVSYEEWDAPPFEAINANIKATLKLILVRVNTGDAITLTKLIGGVS